MAKNNHEGQSCPGDDAMEVKRAILLNTLEAADQSSLNESEKKAAKEAKHQKAGK